MEVLPHATYFLARQKKVELPHIEDIFFPMGFNGGTKTPVELICL